MEKNNKKLLIIVITAIIVMITILILSTALITINTNNKNSNLNYYKIDNEQITAITGIVGKRKVNSFSSSISNGIHTKKYSYKNVENSKGDISAYINKLMNEGFINTTNIDLNNNFDEIKLAKQGKNYNEIIILTINYTNSSYIIEIQKGKGSIQPYN